MQLISVFDRHYGHASVNRAGRLVTIGAVSLLVVYSAEAKCAPLLISLSGEVTGDAAGEFTVRFEIVPDANQRQAAPTRDGAKFVGRLLFDPTKAYSRLRGHDCSRRPKVVQVVVARGEDIIQRKQLSFPADFVEEALGQYRVRKPIVLDGDADRSRR